MEKIYTQLMNNGFTQDQIEEIKAGFDEGIDITAYANKDFLAIQMREIRFGLEQGLDVTYFCSLMYTAADMRKRRLDLQAHPALAAGADVDESAWDEEAQTVRIVLEEENTAAYVDLCGEMPESLRVEVLKALRRRGITYGIRYDAIDRMASGEVAPVHVLVASGFMPEDGWFCSTAGTGTLPLEQEHRNHYH